MNNIKLAYRNLLRQRHNSFVKILSMGTGLTVGLVLLSKVSFEQNYDDFYPDNERIYRIETRIMQNDEPIEYGQVSGAIAPGMKAEVPGVESATRYTGLQYEGVFYTSEKKRYKGSFIMADAQFFKVFPRPMIAGNAEETLSRSMYALISQSLSKKIGGEPIGKIIQLEAYPGKEIIIGGVFEDIPENSYFKYDVVVSLESIGQFTWDGRDNWEGNDRYQAYVKLYEGVNSESLTPAIRLMQEKNQSLEEMEKAGIDLSYKLVPLTSLHSESKDVKNITLIISIIAFALLLTTLLNYLLILITELSQRGKEFAVNKCYGASDWNIARAISAETALTFLLSLGLAALLLFFFRPTVEEILGASLLSLFSWKSILLMLGVIAVIFILSVFIPTNILKRISLVSAFRNNKRMKQSWKLVLLFVQFSAAAFLITLTASVSKQYNNMIVDHPGYDYKNVVYIELSGVDSTRKQTLNARLKELPEVERTSFSSTIPIFYMSGNYIRVEGDQRDLFNIADLYYVDDNFLPLMNIPITAGKNFGNKDNAQSALVSESFREKMSIMLEWEEVVGKDVIVTEHLHHGISRIVGVFPDIRISSFGNQDTRPAIIHYSAYRSDILHYYQKYLLVRLGNLNAENIESVNRIANNLLPERETSFIPYEVSIISSYERERLFKDTIMIGAIITLVISLIGLIGYIKNEIEYRTSEITIRKINGATLTNILSLFGKNILRVAIPAIIIGCIATYFVSTKWMENFSEHWSFSIIEYFITALLLLILIEVAVILNCIKAASQNPVDSLKK